MFNNDFDNTNNQFVVSYELLALLQWIIEHEDDALCTLASKALASGLKEEMQKRHPLNNEQALEEAQEAIIDFFGLFEGHLLEAMHEQSVKQAIEKNLMPAIDQIDTAICDDATVRASVEQATYVVENDSSKERAKEVLCKELLKQWKPSKNQVMN